MTASGSARATASPTASASRPSATTGSAPRSRSNAALPGGPWSALRGGGGLANPAARVGPSLGTARAGGGGCGRPARGWRLRGAAAGHPPPQPLAVLRYAALYPPQDRERPCHLGAAPV